MIDYDVQRTLEELSSRAQELAGRLESLTAEASDDSGLVRATCGMGGRLVDIQFDPRARRMESHQLREAVLAAAQRAGTAVQEQLSTAVSEFSSAGGGLGSDVVRQAQEQVAQYKRIVDEQMDTIAQLRSSILSRP
ncbi:MAG TPA: YbaB/EbfC family nucleoid-associated protein [Mycobacteriales bacterium]|nr:YbaB/EbfC family nucleoid-associated protein [Mycobacteriales bacterium]